GLAVLPPDINKSDIYFFNVPGEGVRYGLAGIKGVGEAVAESILACRDEGGPFENLYDFVDRVEPKVANKRVIEALIKAGAFDSTNYPRKQLFRIVEDGLLKNVQKRNLDRESGQISMFDLFDEEEHGFEDDSVEPPGGPEDEWDKGLKLAFERDCLGMYLSDHPLSDYADAMREHADISLSAPEIPRGFTGWFAGMLTGIELRQSRSGNAYARGQLEDLGGSVDIVAFGKTLKAYEKFFENDKIVLIKGQYKVEDGDTTLMVDEIKELPHGSNADHANMYKPKLFVRVTPEQIGDRGAVDNFRRTLAQFPGRNVVELHVFEPVSATTTVAQLPEEVNADNIQLLERLKAQLGSDSISIE
ncbi:MAG: DNA polymerase III subunit alpha, partial [Coriobacteriia bacterium]|nr:DNA polymerase III subunit alpha [Coriobacteriia bacterium]